MTDALKGKKVLILGLGQYPKGSGIAAALFAARSGADVLVTDQKTEKDLEANVRALKKIKNVRFRLGEHHLDDIRWADVIIRNPRVRPTSSEMKLASRLGKQIESDISLFLERCSAKIVGITGTRGKSTTSTLVAETLKQSGRKTWLGGNILVSPLTFLKRVKASDIVVLELSSWQLEVTGEAGISPPVAAITNLMRDHLNTYESMDAYAESKAQIFRHQNIEDTVVLNLDDAYDRAFGEEAPGRVVYFSKKKTAKSSAWLTKDALVLRDKKTERSIAKRLLTAHGGHMELNMLCAALTARAAGASFGAIAKTLKAFRGLADRQEVVGVKKGITYVNDTTATTPDATIAALKTFATHGRTIRLIIGGADKELEFDELARELKKSSVDIAVLPGTAHTKLTKSLKYSRVPYEDVPDLRSGVARLRSRAKSGDVLLLSPGCASFGLFKNEFDRGMQFRKLVKG